MGTDRPGRRLVPRPHRRPRHDANLHPTSLVEALHYHRDRWAHVEDYDDFFPFLHFDEFDPGAWAALARDAGMSYAIMTAKHHDGLCWWDAPGTDRTVLHDGPARNVLGQFAAVRTGRAAVRRVVLAARLGRPPLPGVRVRRRGRAPPGGRSGRTDGRPGGVG
ncbi:MAG: alpha-L-fucosidase [Ilumatobacteraceae bacterium]